MLSQDAQRCVFVYRHIELKWSQENLSHKKLNIIFVEQLKLKHSRDSTSDIKNSTLILNCHHYGTDCSNIPRFVRVEEEKKRRRLVLEQKRRVFYWRDRVTSVPPRRELFLLQRESAGARASERGAGHEQRYFSYLIGVLCGEKSE